MVSLFEDGKWLIPDQRRLTCRKTLSLSSGAVPVLDTDPATAPAISCRHTNPDCFSFSENSSGTVKSSPMSNIYTNKYTTVELQKERSYSIYSHENLSVSVFALYHRVFPILSDFLHVVQRVKQEVISPLEPVDGQGMVFIHTVPTHFTSTACQKITPEKHFTRMLSTKTHLCRILAACSSVTSTPRLCNDCWISPTSSSPTKHTMCYCTEIWDNRS